MDSIKSEPARLSCVIGALVSSVAHARSVADAEALRIAHRYRQNEFLKGLPVPRLRLRQVSVDLPVILSAYQAGSSASRQVPSAIGDSVVTALGRIVEKALSDLTLSEGQKQRLDVADVTRAEFYRQLAAVLGGDQFRSEFRAKLVETLGYELPALDDSQQNMPSQDAMIEDCVGDVTVRVFKELVRTAVFEHIRSWVKDVKQGDTFDADRARKSTDQAFDQPAIAEALESLRAAAAAAAVIKPSATPELLVQVGTDEIKNAGGGPNTVTRLRFVMMEEGLEWVSEVRDGQETTRLSPE